MILDTTILSDFHHERESNRRGPAGAFLAALVSEADRTRTLPREASGLWADRNSNRGRAISRLPAVSCPCAGGNQASGRGRVCPRRSISIRDAQNRGR